MHFCGHVTGHTSTSQGIAVFCPHNTVGRHAELQTVSGSSNVLTPADVLAWGVRVGR